MRCAALSNSTVNSERYTAVDLTRRSQSRNERDDVVPLPIPRQEAARQYGALSLDLARGGEGEAEPNLREYWQVISRRKWTVLLFLLIVLATTILSSFLSTPIYRSSLTLQIDKELPKVVQYQDVVPVEASAEKDFYETQYELLRSRTLAKRVIDQQGLAQNPHFLGDSPSLLGWFTEPLAGYLPGGDVQPPEAMEQVEHFLEQLSVEPVKNSRLVKLHYESPDPGLAANVVNSLAANFIQMSLERRMDASSYAKTFLEDRLKQIKVKLEDSEQRLVAFAKAHQIIKLNDNRAAHLETLESLSQALTVAERERISAETAYRQMERADGRGVVLVLNSEVIQSLKETKAGLEARYQEKLKIFKPGYPAMEQLRNQIETIDARIEDEAAQVREAVRADYEIARRQEIKLAEKVAEQKARVMALQDSSIEYNILQREVDTNRELYEGLLQRMKEVGVAGGVTTNNVSIVDRGEVPYERYKPNIPVNALLALVIGLVGGVGMAFLFEHLDDTLKQPEDLERRLQLPVLGVVPEVKAAEVRGDREAQISLLAHYEPRSPLAEAYRSVRTSLLFSTSAGAPHVLLFTSPGPGEGKTTSALNTAITFTQTGSKVLLVDTDLRNPSLHRLFQLDNLTGLTNYLAGDAKPVDVSQHTPITNLFVIPSGPLPPNPAELLSDDKMMELLAVAADKFDYVILDGPPVLGLADALVLANMARGTVVVVEGGVTRQNHLQGALKRLRTAHANVLGSIMAKHKDEGGAYGYHHDYYYYNRDSGSALPGAISS